MSEAGVNLGWTRGKFSMDGDYMYTRTRFNKEFADGDQNEQTLGFSAQPGEVSVTSPDNVMLDGLPLMQTPGPEQTGSGRITTLREE